MFYLDNVFVENVFAFLSLDLFSCFLPFNSYHPSAQMRLRVWRSVGRKRLAQMLRCYMPWWGKHGLETCSVRGCSHIWFLYYHETTVHCHTWKQHDIENVCTSAKHKVPKWRPVHSAKPRSKRFGWRELRNQLQGPTIELRSMQQNNLNEDVVTVLRMLATSNQAVKTVESERCCKH